MKKKSTYTLQRTMIIYFLLIGFASLMVGVEFIADTHGEGLKKELLSGFDQYAKGEIAEEDLFNPINRLRSKAVLMIGIILIVVVIVLTMFIKNITEPLQHMIEAAKKISGGDLSQTVTVHANNEIAALGNVINEMSSNLQEIILLSENLCESGRLFVQKTSGLIHANSMTDNNLNQVKEEIDHLKSELDMMSEVIEFFNFYTVDRPGNG